MHINVTFIYKFICYEGFNEEVVVKQGFVTLTCYNIQGTFICQVPVF